MGSYLQLTIDNCIFKLERIGRHCIGYVTASYDDVEPGWTDSLALHRSQLRRLELLSAPMHSLASTHFGLEQPLIWPHQ